MNWNDNFGFHSYRNDRDIDFSLVDYIKELKSLKLGKKELVVLTLLTIVEMLSVLVYIRYLLEYNIVAVFLLVSVVLVIFYILFMGLEKVFTFSLGKYLTLQSFEWFIAVPITVFLLKQMFHVPYYSLSICLSLYLFFGIAIVAYDICLYVVLFFLGKMAGYGKAEIRMEVRPIVDENEYVPYPIDYTQNQPPLTPPVPPKKKMGKKVKKQDQTLNEFYQRQQELKQKVFLFENTVYFKQLEHVEDIPRRYDQLMQKYHPDSPDGNEKIAKEIQKEYAELCIQHNLI